MDFEVSRSLGRVKLLVLDTISQSEHRRLQSYSSVIPCKSGCSGCCSRLQEISVAEALILYESLVNHGSWADVKLTALGQLALINKVNSLSWFKMNLKCPVLDQSTQTCRGHGVRPAVCSTHFVTSDPRACDPWAISPGPFIPLDLVDLLEKFQSRISEELSGEGILSMKLPIPAALLVAEKINTQSGLSVDQAIDLIYRQL